MEEGSVVEFPLNFCPGKDFRVWNASTERTETQSHLTPNQLTNPCKGYWGIAIKEWQVIKQAKNY